VTISDLPWGRVGLTICYDVRFPALYRALAKAGASFLDVPSAFTKTGEAHWHAAARSRHRERLLRVRRRAGRASMKASARNLRPFADRRSMGRNPCRRRQHEPGVMLAKIDPAKVADARYAKYSVPATWPPLRPQGRRKRRPAICISCEEQP
jgi:predicted amidohydrolase